MIEVTKIDDNTTMFVLTFDGKQLTCFMNHDSELIPLSIYDCHKHEYITKKVMTIDEFISVIQRE